METYDVIVVGGGPAGMMAAGRAAECGRRVLLLEQNNRLGVKLDLTGGGRCNITNAEFDTHEFLSFFGDAAKFLYSPFSRFTVQNTFDFFAERGLPLMVEERKRAFPKTENAADVTRVLKQYMREHNVTIKLGVAVEHFLVEHDVIVGVRSNKGLFRAESVVLATGGSAYRETGSTGDAMGWLGEVGHTIAEATPDIVPLRVQDSWVKDLSGISLDSMKITFTARTGETLSRTGKLLFTHFGLSGPLILNCAHLVKHFLKHGPVAATLDLFPGIEPHEVDRLVLEGMNANKNKIVRNVLKELVPGGVSRALSALLPTALLETKVNAVTRTQRQTVAQALKGLALTVTGTMGYDWAVVCDGGIPLSEVDTRTMASRLHPNLFVTGDLLHISRPTGGYSLQLCWTTGWVVGESA
jgi:predicted Rossmann fold flavoprotein